MNQKLSNWASLAEIVSSIAIVVTLVVLIYETRENTNATYAASYDQLGSEMVNWRLALATNPKALADYLTFVGRTDESADYSEFGGSMVAESLALIYERAYFARMYGRLGDSEWDRYNRSICSEFASRIFTQMQQSSRLTSEFVQYIESCSAAD